jgi:DNA-binding response OmpR family regulator
MNTILIIEDDPAIVRGLRETLAAENFSVLSASTAQEGLDRAHKEAVDLIVLDLRLPDRDGSEVCRELRRERIGTPILVLSAKRSETDKVVLLEIGADDYLTKPFSPRELVARIRALLRRPPALTDGLTEYRFGDVYVDFRKHEVTRSGEKAVLTARELHLLQFFAQREGKVVTRDEILNEVWGYETFPTTRTVDNYVLALRKKLETDPGNPRHFLTVYTSGYKFVK